MVANYIKTIIFIFLTFNMSLKEAFSFEGTILKSVDDRVLLDKTLFLYEDKTNSLTILDIQKKTFDKKFKLSKKEAPSFGVTNSSIWVKMIIRNKTKENNWVLKNDVVWHDYFDFFSMDEGSLKVIKTGDRRPFKTRDLEYRGFAFNIKPKDRSIYYFKIRSKDDLSLGIEALSLKKFLKDEQKVMISYSLFYGAILIMIFYNLITYLYMREISYLYYSLAVASILWVNMAANGIAFQYFYPDSFWLQNEGFLLRGGLVSLFTILFFKSFLLINKRDNRWLFNIAETIKYINILFVMVSFLDFYRSLYFPFIIYAIIILNFIIIGGVIRMRQGYRPARYFVLAFSGFSFGGIIQILSLLGLIPPSFIVGHAFQIGNLFQTVFLAFALGDKFKRLQEEALNREIEARKIVTNFASKLEEQVKERTKELALKNERLKEYDYTVAHDLANPIGVALTHVDLYEHMYTDNLKKTKEIMSKIKKSLEKSILIINKILINFTVEKIDIKKYKIIDILNLALEQLEVKIEQKKATIEIDLRVVYFVCNDTSTMQIFSNIIGNALKYAKESVVPIIKIRSQNKEDYMLISIEDNGMGIKENNLSHIFEKKGRVNEGDEAPKGYGIGLYNVKKMVKENEGEIWVESTFGKGSTFFLKFKKDLF